MVPRSRLVSSASPIGGGPVVWNSPNPEGRENFPDFLSVCLVIDCHLPLCLLEINIQPNEVKMKSIVNSHR